MRPVTLHPDRLLPADPRPRDVSRDDDRDRRLLQPVGFNDDTRAFLSIPARHDVARLVAEHRIEDLAAAELAHDLTSRLVREAYRI